MRKYIEIQIPAIDKESPPRSTVGTKVFLHLESGQIIDIGDVIADIEINVPVNKVLSASLKCYSIKVSERTEPLTEQEQFRQSYFVVEKTKGKDD